MMCRTVTLLVAGSDCRDCDHRRWTVSRHGVRRYSDVRGRSGRAVGRRRAGVEQHAVVCKNSAARDETSPVTAHRRVLRRRRGVRRPHSGATTPTRRR